MVIREGYRIYPRYNGRNKLEDSENTYQIRNRPNRYRNFNCAVGGELGGRQENQDYDKGGRVIPITIGAIRRASRYWGGAVTMAPQVSWGPR